MDNYQASLHQTPLVQCPACKLTLPRKAFYPDVRYTNGVAHKCRKCRRAYNHAYYLRNKAKFNAKERKRQLAQLGLTPEGYAEIKVRQGNKCKICRREPGICDLAVDHCHNTKVIRGLLCGNCNRMLGFARDNIGTLQAAIVYLEQARIRELYGV